jgi:putative phage-type endonuclease
MHCGMTNAAFELISLEQGTAAWLAWRHDGIGASEADAILGRNRWKSAASVLKEKSAPARTSSFTNAAMERGTALEPQARQHYQQRTGHAVEPACLQSTAHPFLRASVDGICLANARLVEIKCGEKVYAHCARHGSVPDYYVGQLQHILAVTGYGGIDFWCYLPDSPPHLIEVKRDDVFIAQMISAQARFWQQVMSNRVQMSHGTGD